ncbi:MAG: hypothetical protein IPI39_11870 [Candidatus Obscuribacter sp.]|nr:hypothetical protein [Candidatus Obscuribacter sp.]
MSAGTHYQHDQNLPSLAGLAAKAKSLERFEKSADITAIAHNLVSDSVTQPFSQALGGGGFGSWVSQNLTALVGDQLEASIQEDIKTAITEGTFLKDHPRTDTTMSLAALEERLGLRSFTTSVVTEKERSC